MVAAMKAKDKVRKDSLSMLLSALKNAEIDKRSPLTEEEENAVVKKELRQSKETYDLAPEERQDIREEMAARIEAAANQMEQEGFELISCPITPSSKGILVFRQIKAPQPTEVCEHEKG